MKLATTPSLTYANVFLTASKLRQSLAQALGSGQPVKHKLWLNVIKLLEVDTVIEHTKDCLLEEAGQCTCDAMTDEEINAELLEKEDAKE